MNGSYIRDVLSFFLVPHQGWGLLWASVVFVTWEILVRGFTRLGLLFESLSLKGVHLFSLLVEDFKCKGVFSVKCFEGATSSRDVFSIAVENSFFELTDLIRTSLVDDLAVPCECVFDEGPLFESTRFTEELDSSAF